jgi:hypothetical protein
MYGIVKSFSNFFLKSYSVLAVFVVFAMSSLIMAADESTVTATMPTVSWGTVATQIVTTLTTVAVAGIGVGISVWVLMLIPRLFRKASK